MKISYIDKNSTIHNLHPASKILWVLGVLFGSIIINDPIFLLFLFLTTLFIAIFGKVFFEWLSFIKLALFFSIIIIIINLLASQNGLTILFSINEIPLFGTIQVTFESLIFGISMSLRLLLTISAFSIITLTINPDDLLQTILSLKFPHKTVFITTIAIRFIPCLLMDLKTLDDSIRTRGYKLSEKSFIANIKRKTAIISPLLSNSLERSIQSAEAMESRGFGLKVKKTFYKMKKTTILDYFFIFLSLFLFIIFALFWFLKIGIYNYYPTLSKINLNNSYITALFIIVFFVSAPAIFSPLKKVIDFD